MFEFFALCLFIVQEQIIYVLKWAMLLCEVLFMPQLFLLFFSPLVQLKLWILGLISCLNHQSSIYISQHSASHADVFWPVTARGAATLSVCPVILSSQSVTSFQMNQPLLNLPSLCHRIHAEGANVLTTLSRLARGRANGACIIPA